MRMFLALMIGCAMAACSGKTTDSEPTSTPELGTLTVHATSYPLAFFAERIGGDAVDVDFPVPADIDPAHWSPDPDAVARAQRADLLLRSGAGDPAWLDLASLHGERVVDTTATVRDRLLERETAVHQHGPDGKHSHGTWAGSTWLDPTLAVAQAEAIAAAFAAKRPEHAESFRSNLAALARELVELDRGLELAASRLGSTPLLYSHPVYSYLQARYALNGRSVTWEPDEMPRDTEWRALRELLATHPARVMLWEDAPAPAVAERLAALGVECVVYAPSPNRPDAGDWLSVMRANVRRLADASLDASAS